jgi:hypothetical protein
MPDYPKPPYPSQRQPMPGSTAKMDPRPDHGETSYKGSGRLKGKRAIITGAIAGSAGGRHRVRPRGHRHSDRLP